MAETELSYTTSPGKYEGTLVVHLVGPLTLSTMFGFQAEFRAVHAPVIIVDLTESPYMDSAGLGLLMNLYVSAEQGKRKFFLTGVNGRIEALIEMTKVNRVLKVYKTPEEAEAAAWYTEGVLRRNG
jgi:anti-sigma B factor antagonist